MSNAITDILGRNIVAYNGTHEGEPKLFFSIEPTLQALYEAVKGCMPEKEEITTYRDSYGYVIELDPLHDEKTGHNKAVDQFLTNLSLLFGVDGGLEKPKGGSK